MNEMNNTLTAIEAVNAAKAIREYASDLIGAAEEYDQCQLQKDLRERANELIELATKLENLNIKA